MLHLGIGISGEDFQEFSCVFLLPHKHFNHNLQFTSISRPVILYSPQYFFIFLGWKEGGLVEVRMPVLD